jgi:hypothetical protein
LIKQIIGSLGGYTKVSEYCSSNKLENGTIKPVNRQGVRHWEIKDHIPYYRLYQLEKMLDSKSGGLERSRRMIEILRGEK